MTTFFSIVFWACMLLVAYTYIGYGVVLWLLVKIKEWWGQRVKERNVVEAEEVLRDQNFVCQDVTLFISAYNEEMVVDAKMMNCLSLDYPKENLQIYWVTDGSTDATNEKLATYPQVTVLFEPKRRGKTAAINRGMEFVTTPIVVFTDANTLINAQALKEIVWAMTDPNVGCVAGEKRIMVSDMDTASSGGEGAYWRYESTLKDLDSRLYSVVGAAGELFAIRTDLFEKMPDDTLLDDFVLSLQIARKGFKTAYCKEAYALETASADMHEEEKRKVRIAAGGLQSVWRLRSLLNVFRYGWLSFQYVSHRVLRWTVTPIALFMLVPLNIVLLCMDESPHWIYFILAFGQLTFYLMACVGWRRAHREVKNKLLFVPYYFLFMNIAVFKGALYLKRFTGNAVWEKAKRA